MQVAGLETVADFDELPVAGFGDVVPRLFRLHRILGKLESLLAQEECIAFVGIDYPGFNMGLCRLAKKLKKPVLFAAPPQIWAWKSGRAKKLRGIPLAVLFEFERKIYAEHGCAPKLLLHPFLLHAPLYSESRPIGTSSEHRMKLLLLPGSRESQALRNLPLFLKVASLWKNTSRRVILLASRPALRVTLEQAAKHFFGGCIPDYLFIETAPESPEERKMFFAEAYCALAAPGTATLELALSATPLVVATRPDFLTYVLGSVFVKAKFFAMPNILTNEPSVPEHIGLSTKKLACSILEDLEKVDSQHPIRLSRELHESIAHGHTPEYFVENLLNGRIS